MADTDHQPPAGIAADPVLVDPVRQRLIAVASEVLGRLSAEEIPSALRGIARFTPARRARLGAAALAAALDADEDFRGRVASAVGDSSAQLVEAVRSGASTAASDPLDTAVVAYLVRPPGWAELVGEATARWSAGQQAQADDALRAEVGALRKQVAALTREARAAADREREAVARAETSARADLTGLRARVRTLTAELRDAERAAADAQRAGDEGSRRAAGGASTRDVELRRAQARIGELERALEAARRGTRVERDVDDARLWLLVDTLTEAAAGIRRELSLPPPTRRPADAVASTQRNPARLPADDPAALDRLLALPNLHLVVDGYNVTKSGYPTLPLADQRARLAGALAALRNQARVEITVAFDGAERPPAASTSPRGVRVLFSAAGETADDLIRRLVTAEPEGRPVAVVTSDHEVQGDVAGSGAWLVPSTVLLRRLGQI